MPSPICRTCLAGSINVYSIINTPIAEIFTKLTNCELYSKDGRPETVCYLCYAQLVRWRRLRTKCRKSNQILTELYRNGIQIVQETVAILQKRIPQDFISTPIKLTTSNVDTVHWPLPSIVDNIDTKPVIKLETTNHDLIFQNSDSKPLVVNKVAICKICLSAVVKTNSIKSTSLEVIYEKLTDIKLVSDDGSTAVCYICRWLLMKCRKFILKANKCNDILTELFRNGIQLTENTISVLNNRIKNVFVTTPVKLFTNLKVTDVKFKEIIIKVDVNKDQSPVLREIASNEHPKTSFVKIWHCDKCSCSCNTEVQVNKHKRFHDPDRKFSCSKCHFRFDTDNHLRSHKKIVHALKYKCDKCPKKFPNSRELKRHKITHTNNYYTCEVCAKVFRKRSGLRIHNNINHPNAKHPCGKCNVVFATSVHLREHELKIHTRHSVYICDICGKTINSKSYMRKHMKFVHMEREKLECDECGKKLPNRSTMIAHLGSHRLIKPLKCKLCPRLFNTSSALSVHKKKHKSFSCKVCSSVFTLKNDLFAHFKIHPELACDVCHKFTDDMEKHKTLHAVVIVKCQYCNKSFSKRYIHRHLRIHTGNKPHCCNVCPKRFTISTHLKDHMATHTGEKKLSCDICDMTFIQSGQLKCHLRVHAGIKPFDCKLCDKKFSEKRGLQCHVNIEHTKRIIFICDMCHKVHTNKEQLIKHIQSHKGKKHHYLCFVCKKTFQTLMLLCYHIKVHKIKKWPCINCDQKFLKMNINRHYHIRHGAHAYACNICEEGTNDVCMLLSHMRSHNLLSYRCQTCDKMYVHGRGLIKHLINVHKIKPKKPYIQYYSTRQ